MTLFKSKKESIQTVGPDEPNVWAADPPLEAPLMGSVPREPIERPPGERPTAFYSDSDARRPVDWYRPQATTARPTGVRTDPRDHLSLPSGLLQPSTTGPDSRLPTMGARDYDKGGGRQVHTVPPVVDRVSQLFRRDIPNAPGGTQTPSLRAEPIFIKPTSDALQTPPPPDDRFLRLLRRAPATTSS